MLNICENCECSVSNYQCLDCSSSLTNLDQQGRSFSLFCSECSSLHCKLRQFKNHRMKDLLIDFDEKRRKCCNCEESRCKFFCLECGENERYLCLGCSVIHPKIKAFRNHRVIVINNRGGSEGKKETSSVSFSQSLGDSSSTSSLSLEGLRLNSLTASCYDALLQFQAYLLRLTDTIRQSPFGSARFVSSATQLGALVLSYFLLIKHLFGRNSTSVHLLMIVGFVLSNYFQQSRLKEGEKKIFSDGVITNQMIANKNQRRPLPTPFAGSMSTTTTTTKTTDDILRGFAEEFPDEFVYERKASGKGNTVSFRPRTRPYVPRKRSTRTRNTENRGERDEEDEWDEQ